MGNWQDDAVRLFATGLSYNGIAKKLCKPRSTVTRHLQKQGMYHKVHENVLQANLNTAKSISRDYTYVCEHCGMEYTPKEKDRNKYCSRECAFADKSKHQVERQCKHCRVVYQWVDGLWQDEEFCSQDCWLWDRVYECGVCGNKFIACNNNQKICSEGCRIISKREQARERFRENRQAEIFKCKECGKEVVAEYGDQRRSFCDDGCARRYARTTEGYKVSKKMYKQKRRAQLKGAAVERVNNQYIFERDRWRCGICGKKVDKNLKYPHPRSASLDHVVPISQGGEHSKRNCQLAHFDCNRKKSDGSLGAEQLKLFG